MKEQSPNYDAYISCYNNCISHFYFYAESAELAKSHVQHILNCEEPSSFEWDKFPGQYHYVAYKKRSSQNYKYIYTAKSYQQDLELPKFNDLLKAYWQKEQYKELIESHKELLEALLKIMKSADQNNLVTFFTFDNWAYSIRNAIQKAEKLNIQ